MHNKEAVLHAVNELVEANNPQFAVDALEAVGQLSTRYPVVLTGGLSFLNPLVELSREKPAVFSAYRDLIDRKRAEAGLPPCWPGPRTLKFEDRKNEYQRRLMSLRRERSGRAMAIENLQRPERDRIIGNARLEFERRQLKTWGDQCKTLLEEAKQAQGGKLSKDEADAIRLKYWEELETDLNERESRARAEMIKPTHMRKLI